MITLTKTFTTADEMDKFIKAYFKEFAPAGYFTTAKIVTIQSYEMWKNQELNYKVTFERSESCD